jgi:predicted ATP-grasp superfamily ATP-dependent carboligase
MWPSLDAKYPALILKMSRGVIHHGALGVARTLGRVGVPVYAVVEDAYTPLAMSRYLTKAFVWDSCPIDPESFVKAMSLIAESIARPTIIIPMDDLSAVFVAENAANLARWFIVTPVPPHLPHQLANKACLHALCAEIGIPSARSVVPHSFDDVKAFTEGTEFPVVVKAAEQWLPLKDTLCAKVIQTREQLLDFCENYDYARSQRLIIQEYIPGDDWVCHGYYNSEKNISVTFTGRKLRAYPTDAGSTALGLSLDNEMLRCASERLLKAVAYSGIIDMDWRKDERDGQYKILNCNPRVGQNFRMFENGAGIDVVRAQHLDLSGRRIDNAALIEGRLFTVESFYVLALLRRLPRGASKQDAGKYLPPKGRELAWWSSDDPVPFLIMSMRLFIQVLKRAWGLWIYSPSLLRSRLTRLFSRLNGLVPTG